MGSTPPVLPIVSTVVALHSISHEFDISFGLRKMTSVALHKLVLPRLRYTQTPQVVPSEVILLHLTL